MTVRKAAAWAELPSEVASVLSVAADVVDRYAHGFMCEDDAVDDLATTMADFVATTRLRARDAREATHG